MTTRLPVQPSKPTPIKKVFHDIKVSNIEEYGEKVEKIGEGAYGEVYKYVKDDQKYAIKKMQLFDDDFDLSQSTVTEITILLNLDHPNIINLLGIIGVDISPDDRYSKNQDISIVMPLAFSSLKDLIDERPTDRSSKNRLDDKKIAYQILRGAAYYMSHDITHNDIKPANILLFSDGSVKITDFGVSSFLTCSRKSDPRGHEYVFSIWYRPPELFLGSRSSKKSDVWALGLALYNLFAGEPLFTENNNTDMIKEMIAQFGSLKSNWEGAIEQPLYQRYDSSEEKHQSPAIDQLPPDEQLLLIKMIQIDPSKRVMPFDLLEDEFFEDVRDDIEKMYPAAKIPKHISCVDNLDRNSIILRKYPDDDVVKTIQQNIHVYIKRLSKYFNTGELLLAYRIFMQEMPTSNPNYRYSDISLACSSYIANTLYAETSIEFSRLQNHVIEERVRTPELIYNIWYIISRTKFDFIISTEADYLHAFSRFYSDDVIKLAEDMAVSLYVTDLVYGNTTHNLALACLANACTYCDCVFKHSDDYDDSVYDLSKSIIDVLLAGEYSSADEPRVLQPNEYASYVFEFKSSITKDDLKKKFYRTPT